MSFHFYDFIDHIHRQIEGRGRTSMALQEKQKPITGIMTDYGDILNTEAEEKEIYEDIEKQDTVENFDRLNELVERQKREVEDLGTLEGELKKEISETYLLEKNESDDDEKEKIKKKRIELNNKYRPIFLRINKLERSLYKEKIDRALFGKKLKEKYKKKIYYPYEEIVPLEKKFNVLKNKIYSKTKLNKEDKKDNTMIRKSVFKKERDGALEYIKDRQEPSEGTYEKNKKALLEILKSGKGIKNILQNLIYSDYGIDRIVDGNGDKFELLMIGEMSYLVYMTTGDNGPIVWNEVNGNITNVSNREFYVFDISQKTADIELKCYLSTGAWEGMEKDEVVLQLSKLIGTHIFRPYYIIKDGEVKLYNIWNIEENKWVNDDFYKEVFIIYAFDSGFYKYDLLNDETLEPGDGEIIDGIKVFTLKPMYKPKIETKDDKTTKYFYPDKLTNILTGEVIINNNNPLMKKEEPKKEEPKKKKVLKLKK